MPTPELKKIHKEKNIPMDTLEKYWAQAKAIAFSKSPDNWGLVQSIFLNKVKAHNESFMGYFKKYLR
jgi:hypothetical protein